MTITRKGKYYYGTEDADITIEVTRFSTLNEYIATRFHPATCACGSLDFLLLTDEEEGAGKRVCAECRTEVLLGDSADYIEGADIDNHICVCDEERFGIISGVALYADSNDVRWLYIGCRCRRCDLVGVFAHWKCEGGDADAFMANL
ncbi:hypothetical protein [Stenotrophomonas sp. PS02289]|uniref:hypothetical protein n=1 Tax=Stenotrophomonas sp. PS02289 TaxID=2991422 RepID=UPI00249B06EB|nr:hypothetical protein [Stenotrophomonas sp. PS02289]